MSDICHRKKYLVQRKANKINGYSDNGYKHSYWGSGLGIY